MKKLDHDDLVDAARLLREVLALVAPGDLEASTPRVVSTVRSVEGAATALGMAGQCWDDAVAESSFATIKKELALTR